jgi:hypothetical protein
VNSAPTPLNPSPSSNASPTPRVAPIPWRAQTGPQLTAIQHDLVDELLYGGAVFGGKSDFLLGDFAQDVPRPYGKYWHGILFRKSYKQLEDLISRSKEIYPRWFPGCHWTGSSKELEKAWVWPNGATLRMRHMDSEDDWMEYWGHAYTWIGWDELALWASPTAYLMLKARLRSAQTHIPNMRIRASANPGGPGHHWVRSYFKIDEYPNGGETFEADDGSGMRRVFIRARLTDNKIGMANDPGYTRRMEGIGSPQIVRALKDGDWTIVAGSYFPEFSPDKHIVEPVELPKHWARIRAMDWGSAKPFCVLWAAVSDGSLDQFQRGALVVYREWYGWDGRPNEGCHYTAEQVGAGIRQLEGDEKMADEVLDPSAHARDGGPSIAERIGLGFRRADNSRVAQGGRMGGWDQVRERLRGSGLHIFSTCTHLIRTLPALQHDRHRPEDVDTEGEDHAGDALRYLCMSRPMVRDKPKNEPPRYPLDLTINELIKRRTQRRLSE